MTCRGEREKRSHSTVEHRRHQEKEEMMMFTILMDQSKLQVENKQPPAAASI